MTGSLLVKSKTDRGPESARPAQTNRLQIVPVSPGVLTNEDCCAIKVKTMWFVIYAKIVEDKENGIKLAGVYFGGTAQDKTGAEKVARECVNTIKGGTIMPRLYECQGEQELPRIMQDAEEFFKKKEAQMATAAAILTRPNKKK